MRKFFIVMASIMTFILLITPVPLGLVLVIVAAIVPFKHWPYTMRLVIRFARIKMCSPCRRLFGW